MKRPRGRPRIYPKEDETAVNIKLKPGPKTKFSSDNKYFRDYYHTHLSNVKITCPHCFNPDIAKHNLYRHRKSNKCFDEAIMCKYSDIPDSYDVKWGV